MAQIPKESLKSILKKRQAVLPKGAGTNFEKWPGEKAKSRVVEQKAKRIPKENKSVKWSNRERDEGLSRASNKQQFVIITGLSGAGKSLALRSFEDIGYFCIDNLPPVLISKFAELSAHTEINKVALVSDIRGGTFFAQFSTALDELKGMGVPYQVLFMDAADETLVRRFSETRRKHPLAPEGQVLNGIRSERRILQEIREVADKVFDTTGWSPRDFKEELMLTFLSDPDHELLEINIVSFGYKYGIPLDADLMFDVRFLPNPFYMENLRALTGLDKQVRTYVMKWVESEKFLFHLYGMLEFLIPNYVKEGKSHLAIAIGCTGGKHRSVVIANEVFKYLKQRDCHARVTHRDLEK